MNTIIGKHLIEQEAGELLNDIKDQCSDRGFDKVFLVLLDADHQCKKMDCYTINTLRPNELIKFLTGYLLENKEIVKEVLDNAIPKVYSADEGDVH